MYNKKMKRIVFISFRCTSKSIESSDDDDMEDNEYDVAHPSHQSTWPSSYTTTNRNGNGNGSNGMSSSQNSKSQSIDIKPVQTVIGLVI